MYVCENSTLVFIEIGAFLHKIGGNVVYLGIVYFYLYNRDRGSHDHPGNQCASRQSAVLETRVLSDRL